MVYEGDSVVEYGAADLVFTELVVEEFGDTNEMLFTDREFGDTNVMLSMDHEALEFMVAES
jgi:hypothetical protein